MAVHVTKGEIPTDAVQLSEEEAILYQWKILMQWKPAGDVWPFKYGTAILATSSALSGMYINNIYRRKLHLLNHGRFSTYLPIVVLPALLSTIYHQQYVTEDILIKKTRCPICLEIRSAAFQGGFSTVYPVILAPLAAFMFATRHYTYNIPSPMVNPKGTVALWMKLTRPVGNTLFGIFAFQSFIGICLAYCEMKSSVTVQSKIHEIEKTYDENMT